VGGVEIRATPFTRMVVVVIVAVVATVVVAEHSNLRLISFFSFFSRNGFSCK